MKDSSRDRHVGFALLIALIGLNFAFDWWREKSDPSLRLRDDGHFEDANDLKNLIDTQARLVLDSSESALTSIQGFHERLESILRNLRDLSGRLRDSEEAPTEVNDNSDNHRKDEESSPWFLSASIETMEEALDRVRTDDFLREYHSTVIDLRAWEPDKLISDLEARFDKVLSPDERELLRLEIDLYRSATRAAEALFKTEFTAEMIERIGADELDPPGPRGSFDTSDVEEIPAEDVFAVTMNSKGRIRWQKSRYPELYRKSALTTHIPLVMLDVLRQVFE